MCGIFGLVVGQKNSINRKALEHNVNSLFKLSESRGKESAGLAVKNINTGRIDVYKEPIPAHKMIKQESYRAYFQKALGHDRLGRHIGPLAVLGHSRLVTNGSEEDNYNNQPVIKSGLVAVHNGIIVNIDELWDRFRTDLKRDGVVDTEVLLALIRFYLDKNNSFTQAAKQALNAVQGAVSVGLLFRDYDCLLLATNTGSLYYSHIKDTGIFYFASEKFILKKFMLNIKIRSVKIKPIMPGQGLIINISTIDAFNFSFNDEKFPGPHIKNNNNDSFIKDYSPARETKKAININLDAKESILEDNSQEIGKMKRCSACLLPETFPFIKFDQDGKCNYCRNYTKLKFLGEDKLRDLVLRYREKNNEHNCIVTLSGGRDSCYTLHYIKKILGLNPIAFTYDWGMVTDLARRNQARMCGQLGVEHILLSADIRRKRANIRKNVLAWLKKPELGVTPLFMAGDKQVHHCIYRIKKQNDIKLNMWSVNRLEKTSFKAGFCGVAPEFGEKLIDHISRPKVAQLAWYYFRQFIANPSFFNSSLFDSAWAFFSQYIIPRRDFYNLYTFIEWDEKEIEKTLINEYGWETSPDTRTTWRIGDGTASFYNYIYYTVAGFTENDTFRSNQIREGMLIREEALKIVNEENRPRLDSIRWYCETINIDFNLTIKIINNIVKLYKSA